MSDAPQTAPWRVLRERPPIAGESLDGYVARVAAAEHIPRAIDITGLGGVQHAHYPELGLSCWDGLPVVADCLRVDVAELRARSYPLSGDGPRRLFHGVSVGPRTIVTKTRRFAPAGLALSAHHRAVWQLRPFPFREKTWQLLTDRCPGPFCEALQRWHHTAGVDRCDNCGEPLEVAQVPAVPEAIRGPLALALGLVHPEPERRAASLRTLPTALRTIDPGELLDLVVALAVFTDPSLAAKQDARRLRADADPMATCAATAQAFTLLQGWPEAVEALATQRLAVREGRGGDGNGGATMRLLALSANGSVPAAVRDLVSGLEGRLRSNEDAGVDADAAVAITMLSVQRIVELRRALLLPTVFHIKGRVAMPLVRREAVERLAEEVESSMTVAEASTALGITHHGVEQLLATGRLATTVPIATRTEVRPVRVDRATLAVLERSVAARSAACVGAGWLNVRDVMLAASGRMKPWGPLIEALAEGLIEFALSRDPGPLAGRILVHPDAVGQIRALRFDYGRCGSFRFTDAMSKRNAAETLNLHHRDASKVLAAWPSSTGPERTVPVEAVVRLARQRVSIGGIAAMLGVSRVRARDTAAALGLLREPAGFDRAACEAAGLLATPPPKEPCEQHSATAQP